MHFFPKKIIPVLLLLTAVPGYCGKEGDVVPTCEEALAPAPSSPSPSSYNISAGSTDASSDEWVPIEEELVLEEPEEWRIEREAEGSPDAVVVTMADPGSSELLETKDGSVVYKVEADGRRMLFYPRHGESRTVGQEQLGNYYISGMMGDREVFASQIFKKAGWQESTRAELALLEHHEMLQEGIFIPRLPGLSLEEFGHQKFLSEIEPSAAYQRSRERALVMALVIGKQDWFDDHSGRSGRGAGIPKDLLINGEAGKKGGYDFYWTRSGTSFPPRARIDKAGPYLFVFTPSEVYVRQLFPRLWPLIQDLDGAGRKSLDPSTLRLISELSRFSFSDLKAMARGLETITDKDISGTLVRIHYLSERFAGKVQRPRNLR